MAKIALLGAGWLGEPLGFQLQQAGHQVWASTTTVEKAERLRKAGLNMQLLIVEPTGLKGDVENFFAADILVLSLPPGGRRDPAVAQNYPAKIAHVVAAAKLAGVKQLLFTSSTGIYGKQEGGVHEKSPLLPVTNSGKALLKVEQQLKSDYADQLSILRLAGLFGANRQPGRWFAGKKDIAGGNQYVNLVHRADVLASMQAVIDQNAWGHTLNICGDEHPVKADFYSLATQKIDLEPPVFIMLDDNTPSGKLVDNAQSKSVLGASYPYTRQYFDDIRMV